jgi:ribonuclease Z
LLIRHADKNPRLFTNYEILKDMAGRSKSFLYTIWNHVYKLPKVNLTLQGHSRGSEASGFYIPELELCFDAGIQCPFKMRTICITHCHCDHSACLPMMMMGVQPKPKVYVPKSHLDLFETYAQSQRARTFGTSHVPRPAFYGVEGGDVISLQNEYALQVYNLHHSAPTCGYGLGQYRKKLKPEYADKTGKEIADLRKQEIDVHRRVFVPLLAYLCDTSIQVFQTYPSLMNYPILVVECTFLEQDLYMLAQNSQHIHWSDLKPFILENPRTTFILIHFSVRYSDEDLDNFFGNDNLLPNVILWKN